MKPTRYAAAIFATLALPSAAIARPLSTDAAANAIWATQPVNTAWRVGSCYQLGPATVSCRVKEEIGVYNRNTLTQSGWLIWDDYVTRISKRLHVQQAGPSWSTITLSAQTIR